MDIKLRLHGQNDTHDQYVNSTATWDLGACKSVNFDVNNTVYKYPGTYTERCCLLPGNHLLKCYNVVPVQGWKDAQILIEGHEYCDDFISYTAMRKIVISSNLFKIL